jgi:hypothetical protein
VKTNSTVRLVEHSLGAVFWTWRDFVGERRMVIEDLLEFSHLPRGKYVIVPVGPVGQDLTTHYMCPCGSFLATGTKKVFNKSACCTPLRVSCDGCDY